MEDVVEQLDEHGQPVKRQYSCLRLQDRTINELIGLCRGIAADGVISQSEAEFLKTWMEANVSYNGNWMVSRIYCRIQEMLIDNVLDESEQQELFQLLRSFTGDISPAETVRSFSSTLPLNDPQPVIEFPTMAFCLTGQFAYGPRRICEEVIIERGGQVKPKVSKSVQYLVIGSIGSTDWAHTSYGRKIEEAVELRETCGGIVIVSEDHWAHHAFNMVR